MLKWTIPVVKLADADAQPGTVMVIPLNTVIASLAMNGPQRSVDTALNAVLLINIESARYNHIFKLRHVEMVDRRDQGVLLIPFVLVHDLRDDTGISVNTPKQRIKR